MGNDSNSDLLARAHPAKYRFIIQFDLQSIFLWPNFTARDSEWTERPKEKVLALTILLRGFRLIFTNLFRDDVGAYVGSHRGVNLHMQNHKHSTPALARLHTQQKMPDYQYLPLEASQRPFNAKQIEISSVLGVAIGKELNAHSVRKGYKKVT